MTAKVFLGASSGGRGLDHRPFGIWDADRADARRNLSAVF
jgi:hypothetical protein